MQRRCNVRTDRPESIELFSPLCPADCASRLKAAIDSEWALFGSGPVIGRVSESSLRLRKRISYGNSFQSILVATLRPERSGTLISGTCGMRSAVRLFMLIWFAGIMLIGGGLLYSTLAAMFSGAGRQPHDYLLVLIPPGMLVLGFALTKFGRHLARNETQFIRQFLIQTLDAYSR